MNARFRPVDWCDINKPGAPIVGWGIERKLNGDRRYKPVGYNGLICPFKTKKEAQAVCNELNNPTAGAVPASEP